MGKKQKIVVIVGPTSSGKSALAVTLARALNGEIVSADSRQVYRGLNIGTGKVTKKEMRGVPHHLLDVVSPKRTFTAHDFVENGRVAISDIATRGKLPIMAGGTGFYIDALLGRIALPDVPTNTKLRDRLKMLSNTELFAQLKRTDPRRARGIDRNNPRRLIRALEIAHALGHVPPLINSPRYETLWIGIAPEKNILHEKITARLHARMRRGMVAEARRLHAEGLSFKRMESFGLEYRSLARFLQGKTTSAEMYEQLDRDIRHYAKRQLSYWKRNTNITWFKPSEERGIERTVRSWLVR